MFEKKFAITRVVGDEREVLKLFGENEKDKAIAYGAEVAATNDKGIISCILAIFDEDNRIKDGGFRLFEAWK